MFSHIGGVPIAPVVGGPVVSGPVVGGPVVGGPVLHQSIPVNMGNTVRRMPYGNPLVVPPVFGPLSGFPFFVISSDRKMTIEEFTNKSKGIVKNYLAYVVKENKDTINKEDASKRQTKIDELKNQTKKELTNAITDLINKLVDEKIQLTVDGPLKASQKSLNIGDFVKSFNQDITNMINEKYSEL